VYVRLAAANSAGKFAGNSELHLELIRLEFRGHYYPLASKTYSLAGGSGGKGTAEKVGGRLSQLFVLSPFASRMIF
jgi:hypothetical protein